MPSQKRKAATSSSAAASAKPSSKKPKTEPAEIVGGLNGDYRITGTESTSSSSSGYRTFTIPADDNSDKVIPCQERRPPSSTSISTATSTSKPSSTSRSDPKSKSKSRSSKEQHHDSSLLIFTHGAGGGLENPATKHFADGYGATGRIVSFQGTMNLQSRVRNFAAVIDEFASSGEDGKGEVAFAVGGRSMGARAAVMAAQDRENIKKLVLVSYPLKSPAGDVRDKILLDLPGDKEVLFVVGSEDAMCALAELHKVRKKMKARSCVVVVEEADHGMSLKLTGKGLGKKEKEVVVERVRKESGRVAADWVRDFDSVEDGRRIVWVDLEHGNKEELGEENQKQSGGDDEEGLVPVEKKDVKGRGSTKRKQRQKKA